MKKTDDSYKKHKFFSPEKIFFFKKNDSYKKKFHESFSEEKKNDSYKKRESFSPEKKYFFQKNDSYEEIYTHFFRGWVHKKKIIKKNK